MGISINFPASSQLSATIKDCFNHPPSPSQLSLPGLFSCQKAPLGTPRPELFPASAEGVFETHGKSQDSTLRPNKNRTKVYACTPYCSSRMRSEGFSFNSGGLEVGVMFAQHCSSDRSMFTSDCNRSQHVPSEVAKPHNWAALTKCDQDDVLEVDFLANSVLSLRFATCFDVALAFCAASAILLKRVNGSVLFSCCGRGTLCCCIL